MFFKKSVVAKKLPVWDTVLIEKFFKSVRKTEGKCKLSKEIILVGVKKSLSNDFFEYNLYGYCLIQTYPEKIYLPCLVKINDNDQKTDYSDGYGRLMLNAYGDDEVAAIDINFDWDKKIVSQFEEILDFYESDKLIPILEIRLFLPEDFLAENVTSKNFCNISYLIERFWINGTKVFNTKALNENFIFKWEF